MRWNPNLPEQVSDDLGSPTNNEGRVSELVNEERVM